MHRIDIALLVMRLVFGVFLAAHGVNKIRGGIEGTSRWFASIGMRWPGVQAWLASGTEIICGSLFAAGLLTPLAAAAMIATMLVAIVTVHRKVGFFIFLPGGGWEYCASIAALAAAVSVAGPGRWSMDNLLGVTDSTWTGTGGVAIGLLGAAVHLVVSWRPGGGSA